MRRAGAGNTTASTLERTDARRGPTGLGWVNAGAPSAGTDAPRALHRARALGAGGLLGLLLATPTAGARASSRPAGARVAAITGVPGERAHVARDREDDGVHRLPVSAFAELPVDAQRVLSAEGCLVPQPMAGSGGKRFNVLRGSFVGAAPAGGVQQAANRPDGEWAVLCSRQVAGRWRSVIAVVQVRSGRAAEIVARVGDAADADFVADGGEGNPRQYQRILQVAPARQVAQLAGAEGRAFGGRAGIRDIHGDAGLVIHALRGTRWVALSADTDT